MSFFTENLLKYRSSPSRFICGVQTLFLREDSKNSSHTRTRTRTGTLSHTHTCTRTTFKFEYDGTSRLLFSVCRLAIPSLPLLASAGDEFSPLPPLAFPSIFDYPSKPTRSSRARSHCTFRFRHWPFGVSSFCALKSFEINFVFFPPRLIPRLLRAVFLPRNRS